MKYRVRKELELCIYIDVTADNEEEAQDIANDIWDDFVPYNKKGSKVGFTHEQETFSKVVLNE